MLSDTKIKQAKPKAKRYKLHDIDGLMVVINPSGNKSWQIRCTIDGKRIDRKIGDYPSITLSEARKIANDIKIKISRGENPFIKSDVKTFADICDEFIAQKQSTVKPSYYRTIILRLNKYLLPAFGDKPIDKVNISDVRDFLLTVEKYKVETARKLQGLLVEIFRFASIRGYIEFNPADSLKGLLRKKDNKHYPFITDKKILADVLRLIEQSTASIPIAIELKIMPHVFLRPSELRLATWDEIDLNDKIWKIPSERMKMGRTHLVPLSNQVVDLFNELKPITGNASYVFPGQRYGRPHSESLLNISLKNLGIGSDVIVPHGFRHTASTMLHELGFDHAHIEKQLAHAENNTVSAVYNHAEYLDKRREMMQAWSDFLDDLKSRC